MKKFTPQDVIDYYDSTESHYRMFWKFEESLGLHYGIWDSHVRTLSEAIMNNNVQLAKLGDITPADKVLDAGCGVGGSAIYLARHIGCEVTGITLSSKQVATANKYAQQTRVSQLLRFFPMNYTATTFADNSFDVVWALESMQTAAHKTEFLWEARRILKPGGRLLISDLFKSRNYDIDEKKYMRMTLHGWAISDLLTEEGFLDLGKEHGFSLHARRDVTREIRPTVRRLFLFVPAGFIGTLLYNTLIKKASHFSRIHYKTYFAQYIAFRQKLWKYSLLALRKDA